MRIFTVTDKLKARFFAKVQKSTDADGCWLWAASTREAGYGCIKIERHIWDTHRASWVIHNGEIPDKMFVLHNCDIRSCVNPAHLFLGTHQDNMDDASEKGRVGNGTRRLTFEQANEIKGRYAVGGITLLQLSVEYAVCEEVVRRIVAGETYQKQAQLRPGARTEPLTDEEIVSLRYQYDHGVSERVLAQKFNVASSTLKRLVRQETVK